MHDPIPERAESVASRVLDAAFRVHTKLGAGLLESVYERCLGIELSRDGIPYQAQAVLPIDYDGVRIESGLRLDLLVDSSVVVDLKAVESLQPIHEAQVLTYLKLTKARIGLLINFNSHHLKDGIKRIVL